MDRVRPTTPLQFAARLAARHALARPWTPPVASVLQRLSVSRTFIHHAGPVTLAPHLAVTLQSVVARDTRLPAPDVVVATRYMRREAGTPWVGGPPPHLAQPTAGLPPAASQLAPSSITPPSPPFAAAAPPLPRVLRRQPMSSPATDSPAASAPGDRWQSSSAPRAGDGWQPSRAVRPEPAPRQPALTPADMSRLTNHVMDTLDRRLASFRDRHGRS